MHPSNEHGVVVDEVSLDGDDIVDEGDAAVFEEAEVDAQCMVDEADQTVVDEGQVVHDEQVVRSIREEAIHLMKSEFAVEMSALEEKTALHIFPAVFFLLFYFIFISIHVTILGCWICSLHP